MTIKASAKYRSTKPVSRRSRKTAGHHRKQFRGHIKLQNPVKSTRKKLISGFLVAAHVAGGLQPSNQSSCVRRV